MTEPSVTSYSPYKAAGVVNAWLKADGLWTKDLPPQMFYTYLAKGYIEGDKVQKQIEENALATWYAGYRDKKTNKKAEEAPRPTFTEIFADETL